MLATTQLLVVVMCLAMAALAHAITAKKPLVTGLFSEAGFLKNSNKAFMKVIIDKILFCFKNYWLFFLLSSIILLLLLILVYGGTLQNGWEWNKEVISALLGAATVSGITYLLLKGQANNESAVEQNKKVFENRLKAYESFLNTLRDVVVNNRVDEKSEKLLQFSIATIGMHTNSEDMLTISKNLKFIVQKIKVQENDYGSIWNELMEIVNVLHNSLYTNNVRKLDSNTRKSLRNFRSLYIDETYQVLEYIECSLADYKFDSFIAGKCLFYSIPVKKKHKNKNILPKRVYVTLKIDVINSDNTFNGIIALYCGNNEETLINNIVNGGPDYWKATRRFKISNQKNIRLGINVIKQAFVYDFSNKGKLELRSAFCDIINFMSPLWVDTKKSKTGEISFWYEDNIKEHEHRTVKQ